MELRAPIPGKSIIRATMRWPGETDVNGGISTTVEGALDDLEAKLLDDAGDEMMREGRA
jgi:hypothetical protein